MKTLFRRVWHGQDGQVLYLFALLLVILLGMAALSIDIGFALHAQRELQASADAAATAGALDLSSNLSAAAAYQTAYCYSGLDNNGFISGGQASLICPNGNSFGSNVSADLPGVTMVSGYPQVKCLTTLESQGLACTNTASANAMAVEEQATIPTFFAKVLGIPTLTITAQSLSSMEGSSAIPLNIMLVIDTTRSMRGSDPTCQQATGLSNPTQEDCAKEGVQTLLSALSPCSSALSSCGSVGSDGNVANPVQEVGLLIFPGLSDSSYDVDEYNCQSTTLSAGNGIAPYSSTTNYSVEGLSSDYKTSDSATSLNAGSSNLVDAVSWANQSGCTTSKYGLQDPGGEGTYYAGAIQQAQAAFPTSGPRSTVQNAIILLSDGNATASGAQISSSLQPNQCTQAVNAAQAATQKGTWVFAIAYGALNSGCSSDGGAYTPCSALRAIASNSSYFYSDDADGCASSANPNLTTLTQIFQDIGKKLGSRTRLLPWATP
jgi:Flp pilus assembly protein TadG